MATQPTVVLAGTLTYATSASRAFGSVTVATGDVCVVSLRGADGAVTPGASKTAGTSTISAITVPQNVGTTSTDCRNWLGLFTVTAGGALTVTVTDSNGTVQWDAVLLVATGCAGITSANVAHSSTLVGSLTASANSRVYVSEADWTAQLTSGIAWTPAAAVEDLALTDGITHSNTNGGNYSTFLAHWTNVAGGAVNYGRTAPTSTNNNIVVWEFLGTPELPILTMATQR